MIYMMMIIVVGSRIKIINAYIFKGDIIIDIDTGHSFSLEDLTENELRDLLNMIDY